MIDSKQSDKLVASLAKEAGASENDTRKILETLGLQSLIANIGEAAGPERIEKLSVNDLKIAARLSRSSLSV